MGRQWLGLVLATVACSGSGGRAGAPEGGASGVAAQSGGATQADGGAGGSSSAGAPSGGGGLNVAGASGSGGSSSSAGASGGNGFSATLINAPVQMRGALSIGEFSPDSVSFETNVDIYFTYVREQWDGCTRFDLGSCGYYDCPAGSNPIGSSNGSPPIYYDGGTATVTGLPPAIVAPFNAGNGQLFARPSQQLWPNAGGSISIAVTGDITVPAFTMQLTTPPMVRLLSINGEAAPTSFKRSEGMKVAWSSEGPGSVAFFVFALAGTRPAAVCHFDAAAKQGELPAAVLTQLDPGSKYYLEFRGQTNQDLQVSGWAMSASASTHGFMLAGSVTTAVTLE